MGRNPNRSLFTSLAIAAAASLLVGCGDLARLGLLSTLDQAGATAVDASSDEEVRELFETAGRACPTQMDAFTTLESVKMIDDSRVEYRYLVNETGKKLASRLDKQVMRQAAVDHLKGNPMAIAIANRDLSVEHIYTDEAGHSILSYTINRDVLEGLPATQGVTRENPFDVTPVSTSSIRNERQHAIGEAAPAELNAPKLPMEASALSEDDDAALPREVNTPVRSPENPAGVQANPFVQQT